MLAKFLEKVQKCFKIPNKAILILFPFLGHPEFVPSDLRTLWKERKLNFAELDSQNGNINQLTIPRYSRSSKRRSKDSILGKIERSYFRSIEVMSKNGNTGEETPLLMAIPVSESEPISQNGKLHSASDEIDSDGPSWHFVVTFAMGFLFPPLTPVALYTNPRTRRWIGGAEKEEEEEKKEKVSEREKERRREERMKEAERRD